MWVFFIFLVSHQNTCSREAETECSDKNCYSLNKSVLISFRQDCECCGSPPAKKLKAHCTDLAVFQAVLTAETHFCHCVFWTGSSSEMLENMPISYGTVWSINCSKKGFSLVQVERHRAQIRFNNSRVKIVFSLRTEFSCRVTSGTGWHWFLPSVRTHQQERVIRIHFNWTRHLSYLYPAATILWKIKCFQSRTIC